MLNEPTELVTILELVAEPDLILGDTVSEVAERIAGEVVVDDIGRRCVTRETARRLVDERNEWEQRSAEERQRRLEQRRPEPVPAGVPSIDGLDPFETMAAQASYRRPRDEFGLPAPQFLETELQAGRRQAAAKARAVQQMKDDLR